jgi:hypothetical protein
MTSRLYSLRGEKEPASPFMDKDVREYAATKSRFYLSYISSWHVGCDVCNKSIIFIKIITVITSVLKFRVKNCFQWLWFCVNKICIRYTTSLMLYTWIFESLKLEWNSGLKIGLSCRLSCCGSSQWFRWLKKRRGIDVAAFDEFAGNERMLTDWKIN